MLTEKILLTDSVTAPAPLEHIDRFIGFDGFYCAPGAKAKGVLGVTIGPGEQAPVKVAGLVLVEAGAPIQAGSRVVSGELGVALQAAPLAAVAAVESAGSVAITGTGAIPEGAVPVTSTDAQPEVALNAAGVLTLESTADVTLSGSELPEATNGIAWTSASAPGEKILVKLE